MQRAWCKGRGAKDVMQRTWRKGRGAKDVVHKGRDAKDVTKIKLASKKLALGSTTKNLQYLIGVTLG